MANRKDITGRRFGRLIAIKYDMPARRWICQCDCGGTSASTITSLVKGQIKSCGCYRREQLIKASRTHGRTHTTEYRSWRAMKRRCLNPNASQYSYYGGRGITVCKRWMNFENFFNDMGEKPTLGHSLERRNNNGNYSPKNCYWATRSEQVSNRRPNSKRKHKCLNCGVEFITRSSKALYCCFNHGQQYRRAMGKKS